MSAGANPPPRIFGIPATKAPVVAVIRRGPTGWAHVGRWDVRQLTFEPGAWFRGRILPQKCDLSPDGRWFGYSAHKHGASWQAGSIYEAVSRLPWLTALAAWEVGTTYGRGFYFDAGSPGENQLGPPDAGDVWPCVWRYGLKLYRPEQFNVERRRGWRETDDTPPRDRGGAWDEDRPVRMEKRRPPSGSPMWLQVEGSFAGFRDGPGYREACTYALEGEGDVEVLEDVQWADWAPDGRLLVATSDGRIEIREGQGFEWRPVFTADMTRYQPTPEPPPDWAYEW